MSTAGEFADLGRILVIVPTYNEAENLAPIVGRLRAAVPDADVLVVDDNSPDGTGDLADKLAVDDDAVQVLHRTEKDGLGKAYLAGFARALRDGYDVIVEMDADGSHQPEQLDRLLAGLRDADLVIGSRYVPGGGVQNWPLSRQVLSRGASVYARAALGVPLADATAGYKAFRAETLKAIGLDDVASMGYCFQIDLAWRALQHGFTVVEVPITFVERERGNSKMSRAIIAEAMLKVGGWGIAYRTKGLRRRAARLTRGIRERRTSTP